MPTGSSNQDTYTKQLKDNVIKCYGREPATLDELGEAIVAVLNTYNPSAHCIWNNADERPTSIKVLGFAWEIEYSWSVSNSHSAPRSGVQNWGRKEDAPTGYPGFQGRVWIRYDNTSAKGIGFGSDPFSITMSHTGTGGGGSYDGLWKQIATAHYKKFGHLGSKSKVHQRPELYSWDYKIFVDDWPLIKEFINNDSRVVTANNTFRILNNQQPKAYNLSHSFAWEDPATKLADDEFLRDFHLNFEG